jgi:hypothetical protein
VLDTQRASFSTAMLVIEFHGMITISLRGEKVVFGEHCLQNDHVRWKMPLNEIATFPTKLNTHTPTLARTMHYLRTCTCTKLEVSRTETDWIFQFIKLLENVLNSLLRLAHAILARVKHFWMCLRKGVAGA